ncbi:MAG TPA: hypothetical protein VFN61_09470, partial [Acidimicrobiales bacterium]|nr:hypothetical protein [Acidimicrobiales bacterium]
QTRAVAALAVQELHLDKNPAIFLQSYRGTATSGVILSVQLSAPTPADAVVRANAVAQAFLQVRSREFAYQTGIQVQALGSEIKALQAKVQSLNVQIQNVPSAGAGSQAANEVTSLVSERSSDQSQISQIQQQQQQDQLALQAVNQGSRVLDPAVAYGSSMAKVIAMDGLTGLVGGLGLAFGVIVVGELLSDRPRRRSEVAAMTGTRVELSMGPVRPRRLGRRRALRRYVQQPTPMMALAGSRLAARCAGMRGRALAVVALGPPDVPGVVACLAARQLAGSGARVVLVDWAQGRPLAALLGVKANAGSAVTVPCGSGQFGLVVASNVPGTSPNWDEAEQDVVLVVTNLSPAIGAEHLAPWTAGAVLVVSAGEVTGTAMTGAAQLLADAGIPVTSAILVGSAPDDESVGTLTERTSAGQTAPAGADPYAPLSRRSALSR